jgi:hypothetical protein
MLPAILRRFARVPFKIHEVISSRRIRFGICPNYPTADNIVAVKASDFTKIQQIQLQQAGRKRFNKIHKVNKHWHLVQDEQAGGSNPLAPTIFFNPIKRLRQVLAQ